MTNLFLWGLPALALFLLVKWTRSRNWEFIRHQDGWELRAWCWEDERETAEEVRWRGGNG